MSWLDDLYELKYWIDSKGPKRVSDKEPPKTLKENENHKLYEESSIIFRALKNLPLLPAPPLEEKKYIENLEETRKMFQ